MLYNLSFFRHHKALLYCILQNIYQGDIPKRHYGSDLWKEDWLFAICEFCLFPLQTLYKRASSGEMK